MWVEILTGIDGRSVVKGKIAQAFGQLVRLGHGRAVDEDRHHRNAPGKRGLNLDPDGIILVVDTRAAALAGSAPFRPDQHQQRVVLAQFALDLLAKVHADWNAVDVDKDRVGTIIVRKPVPDAARHRVRVCPPVRNSDVWHAAV